MKLNRERLFWIGLLVAAIGLGARQAYTLVEYPPTTPSGFRCVGAPAPFWCGLPAAQALTATIGPRLTNTPVASSTPAPPTATIAPATSTATAAPPLALVNGNFESEWSVGWTAFHQWEYQPGLNAERGHPESRHGGQQSLRFFNEFRCWMSGVYQQVDVAQFSTVRFSTWGRTWASYTSIFPSPSDLSVTDGIAVGIDERGGTNPNATGIVWVEADNTEVWRKVTVQGVALSNRITVFIRARLGAIPPSACQWALPFMVAFVDDAALELVTNSAAPPDESAAPAIESVSPTPTVQPPPTEPPPSPYPGSTPYP